MMSDNRIRQRCRSRAVAGRLVIALALAMATGCNASYPFQPSSTVPLWLQIYYRTALGPAAVGTSFSFGAYTFNSDGAFEDVTSTATWFSSNPAALRLTTAPSGFTAVAPGLADVSVTYRGLSTAVSVTVIEVDRQFPVLAIAPGDPHKIGQTASALATLRTTAVQSQNVSAQATWSSSDPRVVTVTPSTFAALVRGVGPGTAWITATFNGLSASYGLSIEP